MDPDPQYRFCYTGSDLSAWQAELVEPPAQHGLPGDPLHPSPALPHARELGPQVPYPPTSTIDTWHKSKKCSSYEFRNRSLLF